MRKHLLYSTTVLHRLLNVTEVKSIISGSVYKTERPANSELVDVVITSSFLGNGDTQHGVSYVNIHAPDIEEITPIGSRLMPAILKLTEVGNVITNMLEDVDGDDYTIWFEGTRFGPEADPKIKGHILSIRAEVRIYNFQTF